MNLSRTVKLTDQQLTLLASAGEYHIRGLGIFARGAGQASSFRALERRGLLEYWTHGCGIDGGHEEDIPLYRPTHAGIEFLIASGEFTWNDVVLAIETGLRWIHRYRLRTEL